MSPKPTGRLAAALKAVGATLKREKKHCVYELPNGKTFVTGSTPSDTRAEQNALSDLRAVAGVEIEERRKAPAEVRAERRARPGRSGGEPRWGTPLSPMAEALREAGIAEQQLRASVEELQASVASLTTNLRGLQRSIGKTDARVSALEALWIVRFGGWILRFLGRAS